MTSQTVETACLHYDVTGRPRGGALSLVHGVTVVCLLFVLVDKVSNAHESKTIVIPSGASLKSRCTQAMYP